MPNGRRYTMLLGTGGGFYRIDDSLVVLHYLANSSCLESEYDLFRLRAADSATWYYCLRSTDSNYVRLNWTRTIGYPNLGLNLLTKAFCRGMTRVFGCVAIWLAKGIGITKIVYEGPPHELVGAIINGVRYGTVATVGSGQLSFPEGTKLFQNYPNPFNGTTNIKYSVNLPNIQVRVELNNILGRRIRTLVNRVHQAGEYKVEWDGNDESGIQASSGIYFLKIQSGSEFRSQKIVLLR